MSQNGKADETSAEVPSVAPASQEASTSSTTADDAETAPADTSTKTEDNSKQTLETILHEDFGEEDEDEEDDESTRERKSTTAPVLRGFLKAKDNALVWMGKWAMSSEQYKAGDKAKFKYTYAGSKDVKSKACNGEGNVTKPLSGKYNGYFCINNPDASKAPTKIKESGVQLTFTPKGDTFEVSGKGSNKFGEFSLSGVYEPASARLAIIKAYMASEYDDSDDDDDEIDDVDEVDAGDVANELATLKADNELSVDQLRAKYAAAAAAASSITSEPEAKRAKTAE